uniref:Mce/MlaD domain-containing protein n=1 Tax=Rhodymenia pseudopalmata TaxID=31502 RepID=A0A1C9C7K8_RHOPU|nr:hypothetical protein Rhodyp_083 [Rhodymenia pseudopalmata]AOM64361.1 hypothetical protein Rhodyp_083 [Rhodymenia pseudopalmata]
MEFNNAHGLKEGAKVLMRGIDVGCIHSIKMDFNSILILVHIKSSKIFIPKNCIIETSQTGLLSESVIDIIPLESISSFEASHLDIFSEDCPKSSLICHSNYLYGHRGLNYDDLVRSATRISQRFDDPRFFNSFYIFIQNILNVSNELIYVTNDFANISNLFYYTLRHFLLKIIFFKYE